MFRRYIFRLVGFKGNTTYAMASIPVELQGHRPSSDLAAFREKFALAKNVVVLTGAGISAESGIPTFRGAGGLWRKWPAMGHVAIVEAEKKLELAEGRHLVVITQNIDELHKRAGSKNVIELHGSLFKTRCTECKEVAVNRDSPICAALACKGEPDMNAVDANIPCEDLPRCKSCSGLLRPHVVWFGEGLDPQVLMDTQNELDKCDLCLVVGTSAVVYPAAGFAPMLASRGVPVAEFNLEDTPATSHLGFHFKGPSGEWLPKALA